MIRIKSDCWDSGNSLTRFFEYVWHCSICGGRVVSYNTTDEICPACKEQAAEALKLTATDLLEHGVIDRIVPEPVGGAHRDPLQAGSLLKKALIEELKSLKKIEPKRLVQLRIEKFSRMGAWKNG